MITEPLPPLPDNTDPRVQLGLCLLDFSDALSQEGSETTLDQQLYVRFPHLIPELSPRFELLRELHRFYKHP